MHGAHHLNPPISGLTVVAKPAGGWFAKYCLCAGLLLWFFGCPDENLWAQSKAEFATVDYSLIAKEYYKSRESQARLQEKGDQFQKEITERATTGNELVKSYKKLQEDLRSPVLSESKKKEITGQLKDKEIEIASRQKMFQEFERTSMGILKNMQVQEAQTVLEQIHLAVSQVAKNKYTIVFAKSQIGPPVAGMITFSEGVDDITPQVLAILNKDAPAAAKKEEKK